MSDPTRSDFSDLDFGATLRGFAPGQQVLKRYTLVRMLGRGGMGVVWLARDNELERELALKFLPETIAHDRSAVDDLKREVRRAIDLAHPHIVKIHDFVTDGTVAAVAMEHVDGDTLSALRVARPGKVFSTDELRPWLEQLCGALDYAHQEARIVHRDLKPANLMVSRAGRLKVLDFGIAASISESASRVSNRGTSGTLAYMSPQQLLGKSPTTADDIYAIGATLYELLTGKPPFFRGDVTHQVLHDAPAPVSERRRELALDGAAAVPPAWDNVVRACLAKDPAQRPAGGAAVLALLRGEVPPSLPTPAPAAAPAAVPTSAPAPTPAVSVSAPRPPVSPTPTPPAKREWWPKLLLGGAAVLLVLSAGYFFGIYQPEQRRLAEIEQQRLEEIARLEREKRTEEANRLRTQQEKAAAEAREKLAAEERAYGVIVSRIEGCVDGLPDDRVKATAAAVDAFLASAPARHRDEIQSKWTTRRQGWEAARLAAARGGARIVTTPAGAEVRFGAVALERSPLTLKELKLGRYPVRARLDGYEPYDGEIEIRENEFAELNIPFVRSTGKIEVSSDPAGAEFVLKQQGQEGAERRGRAPVKLEALPTGRYTVTAQFPGLAEISRELVIERNVVRQQVLSFAYGRLQVDSDPAGAEVWSGGSLLGKTPFVQEPVATGDMALEVRHKGYARQKLAGRIGSGRTLELRASLKKGGYDAAETVAEEAAAEIGRIADAETRASLYAGLAAVLNQLGGVPEDLRREFLNAQFEAARAIPNPLKQLTQLSSGLAPAAELDLAWSRRWTEQAVSLVPRFSGADDRHMASIYLDQHWMHPDLALRGAAAMDGWFSGSDEDWVWLLGVAKLHLRFGDEKGGRALAQRANGQYRNDSVRDGINEGLQKRRFEPLYLSALRRDREGLRRQVQGLSGEVDLSTVYSLVLPLFQLGEHDLARRVGGMVEAKYAEFVPSTLVTYALIGNAPGVAEQIAASLSDTKDAPRRSTAYREIAAYYCKVGRLDRAKAAVAQCREFGNEYSLGIQQLVPVLVRIGEIARARQLAQQVANPFDKEKAYLAAYNGRMFLSLGDTPSYERCRQIALAADRSETSRSFDAYMTLQLLCDLGRLPEAEALLADLPGHSMDAASASAFGLAKARTQPPGDFDSMVDTASPGLLKAAALLGILQLKLENQQLARARAL